MTTIQPRPSKRLPTAGRYFLPSLTQTDNRALPDPVLQPKRSVRLNKLIPLSLPILTLLAWQLATSQGWVEASLLASPADTFGEFAKRVQDGSLLENLAISGQRLLVGLSISVGLGILLGFISGLTNIGHQLLDGPLTALKAIPFPALIPLLLIWLGIGEPMRLGIIVLAAMFPVYLNTVGGIRGIDPKLKELAISRGVTGRRYFIEIVIPGALPQILVGLRLAVIISLLALVFAEEIGADSGLGYMLFRAQQFSQTSVILVVATLYGLLGILVSYLLNATEKRLTPWKQGRSK